MIYTGTEAKEWAQAGALEQWVQRFLRNAEGEHANPNVGFADGLLLEKRFYIGPVDMPLTALETVRVGADISDECELEEFHRKVDLIAGALPEWDMPPFIVQYRDNAFQLTDGNHRYAALRKRGTETAPVIVWGSAQYEGEAREKLHHILAD